jgi:hypothetical protein
MAVAGQVAVSVDRATVVGQSRSQPNVTLPPHLRRRGTLDADSGLNGSSRSATLGGPLQ